MGIYSPCTTLSTNLISFAMKKNPTEASKQRGRPLSFDREAALHQAMLVFWRQGYESTSVNELTAAMGITPPSLYAAFGDKERLFLEAVDRYSDGPGNAAMLFQRGTSARGTIAQLLEANAKELSRPNQPRGCMVIAAAVNGSVGSLRVQEALRKRRREVEDGIYEWILRGIESGELQQGVNPRALAKFYYSVLQGMTLQARDGTTRKELLDVAELAMNAWPGA